MTLSGDRRWVADAIATLTDDAERTGPTPVESFPLPDWGLRLVLKDESRHHTGGLKHRVVRELYRYALACGHLAPGRTVVQASDGGAAVAGAYFAHLLGLPFVAVLPGDPDPAKASLVEQWGGRAEFTSPPLAIYGEAHRLAGQLGGYHLDHLALAERAVDWRATSIADELFSQLSEPPRWVVVGAGTGATSAALGRHIRVHGLPTRLAVVDPERSAYFPGWATGSADYATGMPSRIEGIGRPRMEPGFIPDLADLVLPVPDAASVAAARLLREVTGLPVGGSSGTNLWGAVELLARMRARGERGTVATLIADADDRHLRTYHDEEWARTRELDPTPHDATLRQFLADGTWPSRSGAPHP